MSSQIKRSCSQIKEATQTFFHSQPLYFNEFSQNDHSEAMKFGLVLLHFHYQLYFLQLSSPIKENCNRVKARKTISFICVFSKSCVRLPAFHYSSSDITVLSICYFISPMDYFELCCLVSKQLTFLLIPVSDF